MKRRFAGVLAALLILVLGTTNVFAAGSPTPDKLLEQKVSSLNSAITSVKVQNATLQNGTVEVSKETYQEANKKKKDEKKDVIVAMTDITGISADGNRVTITLTVPQTELMYTDKAYVMHWNEEKGKWEYFDPVIGVDKNGDTTVTVTMDSFSPIFIVRTPNSTNSGSGSSSGSGSGSYVPPSQGTTSPGTNPPNQDPQKPDTPDTKPPVDDGNNGNDGDEYDDGYSDGYDDGYNAAIEDNKDSSSGNAGTSESTGTGTTKTKTTNKTKTSPKTGAALPALPFVALLAAGLTVCGKKSRKNE
ncbi:MAG: hypothetical protein NC180_01095 [Muribaculaceae bacterium]|nr:hypothetical protein [Roseburia sp.]MCM1431368.1 hypothetical protein [Muribaculaceae bacterium]MCM1491810.1 hypothetical protein [Muribaculaceae bacterium]